MRRTAARAGAGAPVASRPRVAEPGSSTLGVVARGVPGRVLKTGSGCGARPHFVKGAGHPLAHGAPGRPEVCAERLTSETKVGSAQRERRSLGPGGCEGVGHRHRDSSRRAQHSASRAQESPRIDEVPVTRPRVPNERGLPRDRAPDGSRRSGPGATSGLTAVGAQAANGGPVVRSHNESPASKPRIVFGSRADAATAGTDLVAGRGVTPSDPVLSWAPRVCARVPTARSP